MTNPVNIPRLANIARPVVQIENGKAITTSIEVARVFGKRHDHVMRDIKNLLDDVGTDRLPNFEETVITRPNPSGGEPIKSPAYHLTRDGFTLLAMGFTGKRALAFKLAYIDAFNKMEAALTGSAQHALPMPPAAAPELQTLVDQLAALNHQAVSQASQLKASATQAHERMTRAHALASTAASKISQHILKAALKEDIDLAHERWLVALGYDGKTLAPQALRIERDASVLSINAFIAGLRSGDIGGGFSDAQWNELAQLALTALAWRAQAKQVSLTA